MKIALPIKKAVRRWLFVWIDRRAPRAVEHRLHLNNLYVLPTRAGLLFLLVAFLIWLLGTNYQNNLILALAYLQVSLLVVVIFKTYQNLAGIEVRVIGSAPNFVNSPVGFTLQVRSPNPKGADNVCLKLERGAQEWVQLPPDSSQRVNLSMIGRRRGVLRPDRLLVKSVYPLGLVQCWSWLNLEAQVLVYPQPKASAFPAHHHGSEEEGHNGQKIESEDVVGLRSYQHGDSLRQIAWKHYARDKGLYRKELAQYSESDSWLDWQDFYRGEQEICLSQMSYWVQELSQLHRSFGLRLPGLLLEPAAGELHRIRALSALARHGES